MQTKYDKKLELLTKEIRNYCRSGNMSYEVLYTFLNKIIKDTYTYQYVDDMLEDKSYSLEYIRKGFHDAINEWDK